MAASKTIGGINVSITASTDKFAKGISSARNHLSTFLQSFTDELTRAADEAKGRFDKAFMAAPPSEGINKFFDDIKKRAEENAAAIEKLNTFNLTGSFKDLQAKLTAGATGWIGGVKSQFENMLGPLGNAAMGGLGAVKSAIAGGRPMGAPASVGFRSLAAEDPLSREGHSQRVRSLAQSGLQKIAQKQLDKQDKMERHLAKIASRPPLAAANLHLG